MIGNIKLVLQSIHVSAQTKTGMFYHNYAKFQQIAKVLREFSTNIIITAITNNEESDILQKFKILLGI